MQQGWRGNDANARLWRCEPDAVCGGIMQWPILDTRAAQATGQSVLEQALEQHDNIFTGGLFPLDLIQGVTWLNRLADAETLARSFFTTAAKN